VPLLFPGTQIDRYELVSPIGEGGMAEVWVARQRGKHGFEKLFAFKCIHPRFADEPAFRSMFLDEARIAAAIEHPNVAQVFDLGESDSLLYLVIEYVDGESLRGLMTTASMRADASVPVPVPVALRIMADACAGLQAAHGLRDASGRPRGVVHRDVSPHNIIVSVRGDVKVIDFGIAHATDRIGGDTKNGALKGKLHYMAPEQALREKIGPFTDVFSAGATLHRMLAGSPPFDGGNDAATLQRLVSGSPPDPLPDSVPPLVAAIVERALARDPEERYVSAREMQNALEAAIAELRLVANVGAWVTENLSASTRERRAALAARTPNIAPAPPPETPSFVAELAVPTERLRPAATAPAPVGLAPPLLTPALDMAARPVAVPAPAIAPIGLAEPAPEPAPDPAAHAAHPAPPEAARSADSSGPGMLDVRALLAQRKAAGANAPRARAEARPEHGHDPASPRGAAASATATATAADPSQADAEPAPARDAPRPVGPATRPAPEHAGARGGGWTKLAVLATFVVLVLAGVLLLLPMIVRDRILSTAREAGVDLTIERVGIGFGGVSLRGVTAKTARVPGAELRADELFATGFSAREIRVRGAVIVVTGRLTDVGPAALSFYEQNRARLSGGGEPRKLAIIGARVSWTGLLGEGTSLDAAEVGVDFESRAVGAEEIRASVARFEVKTHRTVLGPWAGTFDRNATTARLRLLLDPPVPDGPSVLLVYGSTPTRVTVKIPRSPLARLGLRPGDLGLPADPGTELEVKLEGGQSPTQRIEGKGRLDLFGVRLRGLKSPVDVKLEGSASGLPGKPLDLDKTTLTLGPFLANVTGTVTPTEGGFRLDAGWRTVPIACEKLARAEAKALGPIAAAVQDIAHTTGVARVTGTANASGLVKYDTSTPDDASVTFVTREACGLSIFGM
jgi:serine/threonine-protein kinase